MNVIYLKVLVLVALLGGVVYSMTHISSDSVARALAALGIEAGSSGLMAGGPPLKDGEERRNICPNRILAIRFGDGRMVEEIGAAKKSWIATIDPKVLEVMPTEMKPEKPTRELSYMEVEKWLSRHCQIVVRPSDEASLAAQSATEPIEIRYIDGTSKRFVRKDILFDSGNERFTSEDFASALLELRHIALF